MRKKILYVSYGDKDMDEGLSYAVDLAETMDKDIVLLIAGRKKSLTEKFSDLMSAVTFAEMDDHEGARQMIEDKKWNGYRDITEKYRGSQVDIRIHAVSGDAVSAIRELLQQVKGIEIVLLSPNVTGSGDLTARELSRLVQTASRPVVTMAKHAFVT